MMSAPLADATNKACDEQALKLKQRQLTARSRQAFEDGNTALSLLLLKRAQKLIPSESLARKINRIKAFYDEEQGNEKGSGSKAENYDKESEEEEEEKEQKRRPKVQNYDYDEEREKKEQRKPKVYNYEEEEEEDVQKGRRRRLKVEDDDDYDEEEEEKEERRKTKRADKAMVEVASGLEMREQTYSKLFAHQREGVTWLWGLHRNKKGGILADDMGLGKTVQLVTFLNALFDGGHIRTALVIAPVSVLATWQREFDAWKTRVRVLSFHEDTKKQRLRNLQKIQRLGGVLMSTYGMMMTSAEQFGSDDNGRDFIWDYVILDEGHKIKNPSNKTTKAAHATPARHRLILTGTAIQNNLMELWALFDFVHFGSLLGTQRSFKTHYETPVLRSRQRDATAGERHYGAEMAASLKQRIAPFFLRRTKAQVAQRGPDAGGAPAMPKLSRKNDFIVWLFLTEVQEKIYRDFLQLDVVKELLVQTNKRSPLMELTILKKLCDHPRLLSTFQCVQLGLERGNDFIDLESAHAHQCAANRIHSVSDSVLLQESGKVAFVVGLIDHLREAGHRTLIFSQSRKMLDIIEKVLQTRGHKLLRLDGTVTGTANRQALINLFTEHPERYSAFLLTTQVGGIGLTLTAADRVVIIDPSWNPATDNQAVDRAFRIGQSKNVVIYRLITCGTVEEKIYRRQIFKDSITRQATGSARSDRDPYRYFTGQQLRELFSLDSPHHSETQQLLARLHEHERISDPHLDDHLAFLHALDIFGLSDHDRMFSREDEGVAEAEVDQLGEQLARTGLSTAQQVAQLRARAEAQLAAEAVQSGGDAERLRQDLDRLRLDEGSGKSAAGKRNVFSNTFVSARQNPTSSSLFANTTFSSFKPSANSTFVEAEATMVVRPPPIFKPSQSDTHRPMYNKTTTGTFRQLLLDRMPPPPPPPPPLPMKTINISSESEEEEEEERKTRSLLTEEDDSVRILSPRQDEESFRRQSAEVKEGFGARRNVSVEESEREDKVLSTTEIDVEGTGDVGEEELAATEIDVEGTGDVGEEELAATEIDAEGTGDVGAKLAATEIDVEGTGDVGAEELAATEIDAEGTGDLGVEELAATEIDAEGTGDVGAEEELAATEIDTEGTGDVGAEEELAATEIDVEGTGEVAEKLSATEIDLEGTGDLGVEDSEEKCIDEVGLKEKEVSFAEIDAPAEDEENVGLNESRNRSKSYDASRTDREDSGREVFEEEESSIVGEDEAVEKEFEGEEETDEEVETDDEIGDSEEEAWQSAVEKSGQWSRSPVAVQPFRPLHVAATSSPMGQWHRRSGGDSLEGSVSDEHDRWELKDVDEDELERSLHRPEIMKLVSRSLPGTPRRLLVNESDTDSNSELGIAETPDVTDSFGGGVGESF